MSLEDVLDAIHARGPAWASRAAEADRAGQISRETAEELRATGLTRLLRPAEHGGFELPIEAHMEAVAAVGEYCGGASWCAAVWTALSWFVALLPPDGQEEIWSGPDVLISASVVPKTRFEMRDDHVMVQGRFPFASGCDHADYLGAGGYVEGPGGGPVLCFFPPGDGVVIDHDSWDVVGMAGSGSKDLVVEKPLAVPLRRVLWLERAIGRTSAGQLHHPNTLYRAPYRATAAIVLAPPAVGLAKAAIRRFIERMDDHVIMARGFTQRADPAAARRIAESAAEVNAAEVVLAEASRRLVALGADPDPDPAAVASIHRDTAYGVRAAANAVDRLFAASGGSSLRAGEDIQRMWRDVNAARSHAILAWDASAQAYADALLDPDALPFR